MALIISGATIIDGVAESPIEGQSIWMDGARIKAIGTRDELGVPSGAKVIEARGKYVIPGLMDANVHLVLDTRLEHLARYEGRFEELATEAAQVALKSGLTTVFDSWGPRRCVMAVRDRINAGEIVGSRVFCAGNIIGCDGPFSPDWHVKAPEVVSAAFGRRMNATWAENVGRYLMWLPADQVASEVRRYIAKGIDFIKFCSNEHFGSSAGAMLVFSQHVQAAMVEEAHRAGTTAQAHTMSVEGLRIAIEAGCDLIQHPNITGPVPIPEPVLERMAERKTAAVMFPFTQRALEWLLRDAQDLQRTMWEASDTNARNLIRAGVPLLLGNDGGLFAPDKLSDPVMSKGWSSAPDNLNSLATGHFAWFKAMEEKGCPPMEMLRAATRNIAEAYGKDKDLGTLEPGKIADILILDKNPLQSADNYRDIHMILKEGAVVDRDALPVNPLLTKPVEPPSEEERCYVTAITGAKFPMCPMCT